MTLANRLKARLAVLGMTQSGLAKAVNLSPQAISKLTSGDALSSAHLHKIARELDTTVEFLTGETDDPNESLREARLTYRAQEDALTDQNLVPVQEIDLSYGMGGTFLDVPVTEKTQYFPRDWIRRFTRAKPEEIFWAQGMGDSMFPTIADSDTLLIDTSQKTITMADRIWAIAYGDVGMIKRLRPMPDGSVSILSDNASVPAQTASDGELTIIGRVVAKVGKI